MQKRQRSMAWATLALLIFGTGCTKEGSKASVEPVSPAPTEAMDTSEAPVEQKKAAPAKEEVEPSPEEKRLATLRVSFLTLHCLRKSGEKEESGALYKQFGFDDAAAWSRAWAAEAEKNSEWASRIVEEATTHGCAFRKELP